LRRTIAQQLCDAGAVDVNGKTAKSSHKVQAGDELTIRRGRHLLSVKVVSVPTTRQTSRSAAASLFEVLQDETLPEVI
jgi:ribosomal 50S subunit-recycling heat shock protein